MLGEFRKPDGVQGCWGGGGGRDMILKKKKKKAAHPAKLENSAEVCKQSQRQQGERPQEFSEILGMMVIILTLQEMGVQDNFI